MMMRRRKALRRATAIGLAILSAALLAACQPTGYDPGMNSMCFMTSHQGLAKSYVFERNECQGDPTQIVASGNYWSLGSNSPYPGGFCGDTNNSLAYKINGSGSPLGFWAIRDKTALGYNGVISDIQIKGDGCDDNAEISFGMANGQGAPLVGPGNATLKSVHTVSMLGRAGVNHTEVLLYMTDMDTGARHTLGITVPPGGTDPRDTNPFPGVRTIATPKPGHNLVGLAGSYFGLPNSNGAYGSFVLDWGSLLSWLQGQAAAHPKDLAGWSDLWGRLNRQSTTIEVEAQTLGKGSRIEVLTSNFTMYY